MEEGWFLPVKTGLGNAGDRIGMGTGVSLLALWHGILHPGPATFIYASQVHIGVNADLRKVHFKQNNIRLY